MAVTEKFHCNILSTPEELAQLGDEWRKLTANSANQDFYLTYDWFYSVTSFSRTLPGSLCVFVVLRGKELQAIIPCMLVEKKLRFFRVRILKLLGNIYSPLLGAVVLKNKESAVAEWFVDFLLTNFSRQWDLLDFQALSPHDEFIECFLAAMTHKGVRSLKTDQFPNVRTDFSRYNSIADFYNSLSKNMRRNIRKRINKLNQTGVFDIRLVQAEEDHLSTAISHYRQIYNASWKEPEQDPYFHGRLARYLARKGKLRLFILYYRKHEEGSLGRAAEHYRFSSWKDRIDGSAGCLPENLDPICALFALVHQKKAYGLKTAYVERYKNLSPSTVLYWFAMRYFMEEDSCILMDRQRGGQGFKFRWLGEVYETRFRFQAANPRSFSAALELCSQSTLGPAYRKLKQKILTAFGRWST